MTSAIPEGAAREMSRRTAAWGFAGWFKVPLQRVLMSDELQMAIEELKVAKRDAFLARGTPQAQETATRFMKARERMRETRAARRTPRAARRRLRGRVPVARRRVWYYET